MVRATLAAASAAKRMGATARTQRWLASNRQAVFNFIAGTALFVVSARGIISRGQLKDAEKDIEAARHHLSLLESVLTGSPSEWRDGCEEKLGLDAEGKKRLLDEMDRAVALASALAAKDAVNIEALGGRVPDDLTARGAAAGASTEL
ncbi:hypothetical protein FNF27_03496 [Cafeteria roenbergensis]|uniref:Uncharacterized protein n=1 Tax=Cafeteria roenbergensis TaxID=33653 RepID=A0A5A8ECQ4_CAFRO|nr:hypothetical protein FNF29_02306 [Cafeteria roenbergensis]KAA0161580.1 hypothetical protein FNF31_03694 [Cafeteria roenbergensis]KAA0162744.1 hypothetical protein FNF28_04562 [Cafeteria roenbergensis]KAA0174964.1 hypothetical protein FNF27_03496 [Cafeteria roenbergensis]|eukprot:KAA0154777.1 hypothetical protein FNF29_02306 [Cafeteria roenbergensis]